MYMYVGLNHLMKACKTGSILLVLVSFMDLGILDRNAALKHEGTEVTCAAIQVVSF